MKRLINNMTVYNYQKQWRLKNVDKLKKYYVKYEEKNKEHRVAYKVSYYKENKDHIKKLSWKNKIMRKYGLTPENYLKILKKQKNKCAICRSKKAETKDSKFRVDHCHKNGFVRGLLCHKCNVGIGMLGDNFKKVNAAALYLQRFEKR